MIYNRIAVLRAERSLSRQVLAREIGVHPQTVGFLERGDYTPSLDLVFKLSRFFNLPVEAVFSPEPFRPLSEQVYPIPFSTVEVSPGAIPSARCGPP
jgi:putative transcriptional regulator